MPGQVDAGEERMETKEEMEEADKEEKSVKCKWSQTEACYGGTIIRRL